MDEPEHEYVLDQVGITRRKRNIFIAWYYSENDSRRLSHDFCDVKAAMILCAASAADSLGGDDSLGDSLLNTLKYDLKNISGNAETASWTSFLIFD